MSGAGVAPLAARVDLASAEQVGAAVLPYLREECAAPKLAYAEPPTAIAIGAETWVYGVRLQNGPPDLEGPMVLRVFPPDADPLQARFEQVVQNTLADTGCPVPRVPIACTDAGVLGGAFLLMHRIPGRMMLDSLFDQKNLLWHLPRLAREALTAVPAQLVQTQLALHACDPAPLQAALVAAGIPERMYTVAGWLADLQRRIDSPGLDGLRPTMEWLVDQSRPEPERPVICHCDLLPPNLMYDNGTLTGLIDWSHTTIADPAWDVANTRLRIALNPFEFPRALGPLLRVIRRRMTRAYEQAYFEARPLRLDDVQYYEVLVGLWMLATVAEHRRAGEPPPTPGRGENPWFQPGAPDPLISYCRDITQRPLTVPPRPG